MNSLCFRYFKPPERNRRVTRYVTFGRNVYSPCDADGRDRWARLSSPMRSGALRWGQVWFSVFELELLDVDGSNCSTLARRLIG